MGIASSNPEMSEPELITAVVEGIFKDIGYGKSGDADAYKLFQESLKDDINDYFRTIKASGFPEGTTVEQISEISEFKKAEKITLRKNQNGIIGHAYIQFENFEDRYE